MTSSRRGAVVLLAATALVLGGCSDDDSSDPATTTTEAPAEETATPADHVDAFCAEMERLDVETSEDHVGSDEHVADVEGLLAVAPEDVRPAIERYRDFLASGAVTDDPETKQTDSWPAEVQADIETIRDAETRLC